MEERWENDLQLVSLAADSRMRQREKQRLIEEREDRQTETGGAAEGINSLLFF